MRMSVTTTSGSSASTVSASSSPSSQRRDQVHARIGVEQVPERLAHQVAVVGDDDAQPPVLRGRGRRAHRPPSGVNRPPPANYLRSGCGKPQASATPHPSAGVHAPPSDARARALAAARRGGCDAGADDGLPSSHRARCAAASAIRRPRPRLTPRAQRVRRPACSRRSCRRRAAVRRPRRARRLRQDHAAVRVVRARPAAVRVGHADRRHDDPERCCGRSPARSTRPRRARPTGASCWSSTTSTRSRSAAARETLAGARHAAAATGITVALASRTELPLPIARLRAQGLVTELRGADLAMTRTEAAALLRGAGLQLDARRRRRAAAPHRGLARRARRSRPCRSATRRVPGAALARFGGGDRLVAEYLRDEVLAGLSADELRFVLRTSVLDVLTAAAVRRACSSAPAQRRRARAAAALQLPARRARPHRRALPPSPPARRHAARRAAPHEPELEAALHRRASAWHARAATASARSSMRSPRDEVERAGDLVWAGSADARSSRARAPAVEHWLSRSRDARSPPTRGSRSRPRACSSPTARAISPSTGSAPPRWRRRATARSPAASPRCAPRWAATASRAWRADADARVGAAGARHPVPGAVPRSAASPPTCAATASARARASSRTARAARPCRLRSSTRCASRSSRSSRSTTTTPRKRRG